MIMKKQSHTLACDLSEYVIIQMQIIPKTDKNGVWLYYNQGLK